MALIRLLTMNIHKGYSLLGKAVTLQELKQDIASVKADIVCLQEVFHAGQSFESLSDDIWPHYAYGKNAIYTRGNHGNAILSQFPFSEFNNHDVSNHAFERRGILHGLIKNKNQPNLHIYSLHLDLSGWGRKKQLKKLNEIIKKTAGSKEPVIVAGDFNDWNEEASEILKSSGLTEAYFEKNGRHAKTFPTFLPALKLDRIYFRGLSLKDCGRLDADAWHRLSDHLPLYADFEF